APQRRAARAVAPRRGGEPLAAHSRRERAHALTSIWHGSCCASLSTRKRRSKTNVPQLPTNNVLGLGSQTGAPERGLASAHADRARTANFADKRQANGTDDGNGGFGQELKNQLREQREPGAGAASAQGEELPDGGNASPSSAASGADASKLEAVAMAALMPLPVRPPAPLGP